MPGTREEVKDFAKALLVTFLGLVIALMMDNWHQERRRQKAAKVALESVLREVEGDRKALESMAADHKDAPRNIALLTTLLEGYQDARARHQPWVPKVVEGQLKGNHATAGSLQASAWNMALGDLSVQRFPKAQAEDLAGFYQELARFQAFLDQPADYTVLVALAEQDSLQGLKARLERFSPDELERMIWSLRQMYCRESLIAGWSVSLVKDFDAKNGFRAGARK